MPYSIGFFFVEHKPRLMYIWVSGKGAGLMDDVTDDEVREQVEKMLVDLLSKSYDVKRPVKMIRYCPCPFKHMYVFRFNLISL